jgi:1-acylglycerol-3-phosphate O-acyltransferase
VISGDTGNAVLGLKRWLTNSRSLAKQQRARLPDGGSIIASSFTSPIDAIYLAAIFDPIFTASYPNIKEVEHVSLFKAMRRSLAYPQASPPPDARLVTISFLRKSYPNRPIVVFGECTTTNGRGILPLSPSVAAAPTKTKIYPVSVRYTAPDVTTPIPAAYSMFLWNLLSKPTHCIRVRIAECTVSNSRAVDEKGHSNSFARPTTHDPNYIEPLKEEKVDSISSILGGSDEVVTLTGDENAILDYVGEALARLGRAKRVGLGVKEKEGFVAAWTKSKNR